MQDAVLTTLGREMGAYAEALNRDRWRIYKCEERLRVVNLGGTAIGTGFAAPRQYIFRVVDALRELTSIGFARAENLTEATQNADVFPEVSGILKAHAATLLKIAGDLRLMSSGPEAGLGEIRLPRRQAGSSIMPGKVNPVDPRGGRPRSPCSSWGTTRRSPSPPASGASSSTRSCRSSRRACSTASTLLARADETLRRNCVEGIEADEARCRAHVDASSAVATALVPEIGYEGATAAVAEAQRSGRTIREVVLGDGL